ncbi:MAG TPA: fatty acid desaturase [Terriglobales bacterium]|nr:fatty acid desaturase [Terriglobales bacterium]HXF14782.1 fatty acid desaturase [Terriglobales bacterium]
METNLSKPATNQTNWITVGFMMLFHLGALAAVFLFSWKAFWIALALWWIAGGWGIGMGYHRLLTHRGYKTPKWLEYFLTVCGALALEGGPIFWVATHRIHHRYSDKEGDPHTPRDGRWWSHAGWILTGKSMHHETETLKRYVPDLYRSSFHVWISKWHWIPLVILGLALAVGGYLNGGLFLAASFLTWGIFLRTTVGLHCTWLVNSATHLWGNRRSDTRDDSTNNWWVALLTFGEGWHNNHHANPLSPRHGLAWYEFDMNWIGICALRVLGLASEVRAGSIRTSGGQALQD